MCTRQKAQLKPVSKLECDWLVCKLRSVSTNRLTGIEDWFTFSLWMHFIAMQHLLMYLVVVVNSRCFMPRLSVENYIKDNAVLEFNISCLKRLYYTSYNTERIYEIEQFRVHVKIYKLEMQECQNFQYTCLMSKL